MVGCVQHTVIKIDKYIGVFHTPYNGRTTDRLRQ